MNPSSLLSDFISLTLVVLLLGVKHGFDADHLAAIDGMAHYNAQVRPRLARLVGVWFSLGHGVVVLAVALGVSVLAHQWQPPAWLEPFGAWVSIIALTALALLNIGSAMRTPSNQAARLVGWRSSAFSRLLRASSPAAIMGVGTLFALSYDTVSQAALFSVTATQYAGWQPGLLLAGVFIVGMLITDGLNGWWISHLVRRADRATRIASRIMALAVAGVSLLAAGLGMATRLLPGVDAWTAGNELWFGAAVVVVVTVAYACGQILAQGVQRLPHRPDTNIAKTLPARSEPAQTATR